MTILRELIAKIGFDVDTKELDRFDESIKDVKSNIDSAVKSIKLMTAALTAAAGGLFIFTSNSAKAIRETSQLAQQLGVTADDLATLDDAANAAGFEVGQLTNSMLRFDSMLGIASISARGTSDSFETLGINLRDVNGQMRDTVSVAIEASKKILALKGQAKQTAISQRIFGTRNLELARFLGQATEEMEAQLKAISDLSFTLDQDAIDSSERFSRSVVEMKVAFRAIKQELALNFMPVFDDLLKDFKDWFIINKDIIRQNIQGAVRAISRAIRFLSTAFGGALSMISKAVQAVGGLENALQLLAIFMGIRLIPTLLKAVTAVKALTIALLANPFAIVIRAVVTLGAAIAALVTEDIAAWVTGNKSAIGKVLGTWMDFKKGMLSGFTTVINTIQGAFDFFIDSVTRRFNQVTELFNKVKETLTPNLFKSFSQPDDKTVNVTVLENFTRTGDDPTLAKTIEVAPRLRRLESGSSQPSEPIVRRTRPVLPIEVPEDLTDEPIGAPARVRARNNQTRPLIERRPIGTRLTNPVTANSSPRSILDRSTQADNGIEASRRITSNLAPINTTTNTSSTSNNSVNNNNVTQRITENITVNVPAGTSQQQSREISMQVATEVNRQMQTSILEGLDSLSTR